MIFNAGRVRDSFGPLEFMTYFFRLQQADDGKLVELSSWVPCVRVRDTQIDRHNFCPRHITRLDLQL
uniref:Uncharacterized protein n=1 Tax=Trichogramma kaykai TaxID=54128 RepID=A0ABD2X8D9_9HYME